MGNVAKTPIRFGVMGTGYVARQFAAGMRFVKNAEIAAVGSRTRETARLFASRISALRAHGSYEELANDEDVDVIYIATPAGVHAENALLCLTRGKPVLVEKPFAVNAIECEQVITVAQERSLFCMEAMWMRFIPAVQRAITKARSGDIGEVHTIFADFGIPLKCTEQDHRFEKVAGGAWLDRGVYGLSLAIQLFGQPISIAANATTWRTGCDLQSSAILRFHGNRLAIITASLSGYSSNEAVLAGSKGRIRLHETFVRPDAISLKTAPVLSVSNHDKPGRLRERVKESALMRRLLRGIRREKQETTAFAGNGFCHEVTEVVRCLQAGLPESPVMPLQDTIAVMHASDQVRAKWLEEESIE